MSTANAPFRFNSPSEALHALLERLPSVSHETVPLENARGRVLAEAVPTDRPSPAIDVSAMDGFAMRLTDLTTGSLNISGDAAIGAPPITLAPGSAARIVTGAPIPKGADCVIRIEDVTASSNTITFDPSLAHSFPANRHIRRKGENALQGAEVVPAGTVITPAVASALASCGKHTPLVTRKLRIGILSTGDEVLGADASPEPWQLRDGNAAALHTLFSSLAFVDSIETRHAPDEQRRILATASELLSRCDALFLSGGVSTGHRDLVPAALEQLGAVTIFHKVPQRPGKPILGAVGPRHQLILGLPGNPVSVLVTAHRFGLPALERIAGMGSTRPTPAVFISTPDEHSISFWWHRLVKLTPRGNAALIDNKGSGDLIACARSDGFVELPPNAAGPGPWPFYRWRD